MFFFFITCEGLLIPPVAEEMKPLVGKAFDSLDEGEIFFRKYAKLAGFGVRMGSTMWTKDKENRHIYSKMFICAKEGEYKPRKTQEDAKVKRKRQISRMGCKAGIRIQENVDKKWVIMKFIEAHTHPLSSPHKIQFLRSNHEVTTPKKALINLYNGANISTSQKMTTLEIEWEAMRPLVVWKEISETMRGMKEKREEITMPKYCWSTFKN